MHFTPAPGRLHPPRNPTLPREQLRPLPVPRHPPEPGASTTALPAERPGGETQQGGGMQELIPPPTQAPDTQGGGVLSGVTVPAETRRCPWLPESGAKRDTAMSLGCCHPCEEARSPALLR